MSLIENVELKNPYLKGDLVWIEKQQQAIRQTRIAVWPVVLKYKESLIIVMSV